MITTSTLSIASRFYEEIEESIEGTIQPVLGTSVAYVAGYSMPIVADSQVDEIIETSKSGIVDGESHHDTAMSTLLEQKIKALTQVKHLASNVVNPMIRELFEAVSKAGENEEKRLGQVWSIIPYELPKYLKTGMMSEYLNRYENISPRTIGNVDVMIDDVSELYEAVSKGLSVFGEEAQLEAKAYLDSLNLNSAPAARDFIGKLFESEPGRIAAKSLVMLGLAQEWSTETPKARTNINSFEESMALAVSEAARSLYHFRRRHIEHIKQDMLVKDVDHYSKNITVYAENYTKYIREHGGNYESIVGFAVFRKGATLSEAAATIPDSEKLYNNDRVVANRRIAVELDRLRVETVKEKLMELYGDFAKEFGEDGGILNRIPTTSQLVADIPSKDIYTATEKIICRTFFPDKPYIEKLLMEIDRIGSENPDTDINVVALYAYNALIVEWLVDQIQVSF